MSARPYPADELAALADRAAFLYAAAGALGSGSNPSMLGEEAISGLFYLLGDLEDSLRELAGQAEAVG